MLKFLILQYKLGKIDKEYLQRMVELNKITQEECDEITSLKQNE